MMERLLAEIRTNREIGEEMKTDQAKMDSFQEEMKVYNKKIRGHLTRDEVLARRDDGPP
jgi:hypothetical protein